MALHDGILGDGQQWACMLDSVEGAGHGIVAVWDVRCPECRLHQASVLVNYPETGGRSGGRSLARLVAENAEIYDDDRMRRALDEWRDRIEAEGFTVARP